MDSIDRLKREAEEGKKLSYIDILTIINEVASKQDVRSLISFGTSLDFDKPRIYGLPDPEIGNITLSKTSGIPGTVLLVRHNHSQAPTFGSQFVKLSSSGDYVTGVLNFIYLHFVSSTEIHYVINQAV